MPLPQATPGSGGEARHTHWCYVGTPKGKSWSGWIAGPCQWFLGHNKGKTVPCIHWMTGGELDCPRCSNGELAREIGYQPIYRDTDTKNCLVIVYESVRETLDALKLHQHVTIARGPAVTDGVFIAPMLGSPKPFVTALRERRRPADPTHALLKLWRIPELAEWYRQTHDRGAPTVAAASSSPPPKVKENVVLHDQGERYQLANGPLTDDLDVIRARILHKVQANGKPKPK